MAIGGSRLSFVAKACWSTTNASRGIMREDNLLALQPRAFVVTTDSNHELEVYLNLAKRMKLTGINQLWVADITYIRLKTEFVYLAVILDMFSRKVVGWALDRTLAARLPIAALEHAIAQREPPPGLVHHSDRGVQYASGDYVKILRKYHVIPSMSRPANPYDNAQLRELHEDAQTRRNLYQRLSGSGSLAREHRGIHRSVLQPVSPPLRAGLSHTGGVRTLIGRRQYCRRSDNEFFQA